MTLRLPLWLKILGWFFLNLLLVALVILAFVRFQFRFGLDNLVGGPAGERVQAVADLLGYELAAVERDQWDGIIERYAAAHRVDLQVVRPTGDIVAGGAIPVPTEVRRRLAGLRPALGRPFRNGLEPESPERDGPRRDPIRERGLEERDPRPMEGGPPGERRSRLRNGPPAAGERGQPLPMMRAGEPARYWVFARLMNGGTGDQRPEPLVLLASSESLGGGGLFMDTTPWLLMGGAVVVVSVLFWLPLVRGMTRSIAQIDRATLEIAEGNFTARVTERRRDELGTLSLSINQLATRLEGFVTGQKRFLGDIAHELCSPLARMQMALGILEQRADERQQRYVEDVREEVQHMSALVAELLSFSKAGLRPGGLTLQSVQLRDVVDRVVERETGEGDRVELDVAADLAVLAEPDLLARALGNVLRNALRYAGSAGPIRIGAARVDGEVVVTVRDSGPGVPEESLAKLFDPFYRPDVSRTSTTGGVGLGLAIVKSCVEACQGRVALRNLQPHGLEAEIRLRSSE